jgi:hypothetical protein
MHMLPHPASPFTISGLVIWLAAVATLAVFSFLYRENRVYRFAEHILLGLGVGFGLAATITDVILPKWWRPLSEGWQNGEAVPVAMGLLAALLGLLWYGLYHPRTVWLSRMVMGLTVGAGAGLAFKAEINDKLPQILASFKSPYVPASEMTAFNNPINNVLFLIIVLSVLSYFFFSVEHKGAAARGASRFGRLCLMVTFGVFFGNTVMTRMSVFIERIWFLLREWLRIGVAS